MLLNPNPWWSHLPTNQLNEEEEGFFMVVQKDSFQHSVCGVLEVGPVGPSWGGLSDSIRQSRAKSTPILGTKSGSSDESSGSSPRVIFRMGQDSAERTLGSG